VKPESNRFRVTHLALFGRFARLFVGAHILSDLALRLSFTAKDSEIVKKAWERQLTVVTGNGDDFVREINAFQSRKHVKTVTSCTDLSSCRTGTNIKNVCYRGLKTNSGLEVKD
jgi:hypothetical protein